MKQLCLSHYKMIRGLLYSIMLMCLCHFNVQANDPTQLRWQFQQAIDALKAKDLENFQQYSVNLQDYPLYYYLRYQYLQSRLKQVDSYEIQAFLEQYGKSHFGELLRRNWLKQLAHKGDWATFMQVYTPQKSTRLQCNYVQARMVTGQDTHAILLEAEKLWLVGKSQPKACNPVFEYLYQQRLINDKLLWERIGLAMKKGRLSLANALAKRLEPTEQTWVTRWQTMHKKPKKMLAEFNEPDWPITRKIVLHGIKKLAKKQFEQARDYWNSFQNRYMFSNEQIGEMQRDLALASAKQDHPNALEWLSAVDQEFLNDKVNQIRFKLALREKNWQAITQFTAEWPDNKRTRLQQRYWQARAFEQTEKYTQAQQIYREVANERDYYGFLAADRIGAVYKMQHHPIIFTPAEKVNLMKKLSINAAREFYHLNQISGKHEWLANGRREWQYTLKHLPAHEKAIAAALAHRWGWHDRAIIAASKAGYYDDLDVRFPLLFQEQLTVGAKSQNIDLAWVYGIVRQESAFMVDIRSSAGALGLMQLMPATGRYVAKKIGLKLKKTRDILNVDINVSLGTAYLRQMLDKFDGNHMLATAAYNAGPHRAIRWEAKDGCLPADIWVELIPFKETRNYVRRVLFYTRIFESRLGQPSRPIRVALAPKEACTLNYSSQTKDNSQTPG
ncbi:transglycosylase SLT domain-containing protein [Candidatus Parabeggiatoa sp. HSG14]|uniref:lytic transglycosylase domain-containing protein n=1 Tax=Candidatus Parabeggiatoa sp. HSG14 TaxID=3055593 RepID=UPI0025A80470|nr:transglycosylase SLT domain-containing protein [Thiotrichales bacterium HSG14]